MTQTFQQEKSHGPSKALESTGELINQATYEGLTRGAWHFTLLSCYAEDKYQILDKDLVTNTVDTVNFSKAMHNKKWFSVEDDILQHLEYDGKRHMHVCTPEFKGGAYSKRVVRV